MGASSDHSTAHPDAANPPKVHCSANGLASSAQSSSQPNNRSRLVTSICARPAPDATAKARAVIAADSLPAACKK